MENNCRIKLRTMNNPKLTDPSIRNDADEVLWWQRFKYGNEELDDVFILSKFTEKRWHEALVLPFLFLNFTDVHCSDF